MRDTPWMSFILMFFLLGAQWSPRQENGCADSPRNRFNDVALAAIGMCGATGVMVSRLGQEIGKLGDQISIIVLGTYRPSDLTKPEIVKGYLCAVHMAFYSVAAISREEDK